MRAKRDKFLDSVVRICESWWFRLIGLLLVCTIQVIHAAHEHVETAAYLPQDVEQSIKNHPLLDLIGELLPIPAFLFALGIERLKKTREAIKVDAETLLTIIDELGTTVGQKSNARHCLAAKRLKCKNAEKIPQHASTPESQITALVNNVWQIFNREALKYGTTSPQQLKVTLASMESGKFAHFRLFFPENLHPASSENLNSKKSAFAVAAKQGTMLIIEDIEKELKLSNSKYVASVSDEGNIGSIICIPIDIQPLDDLPKVPLVLSIKCDLPKVFTNKLKARYDFLSRPFVERIRLEFYNEKINGAQP